MKQIVYTGGNLIETQDNLNKFYCYNSNKQMAQGKKRRKYKDKNKNINS